MGEYKYYRVQFKVIESVVRETFVRANTVKEARSLAADVKGLVSKSLGKNPSTIKTVMTRVEYSTIFPT